MLNWPRSRLPPDLELAASGNWQPKEWRAQMRHVRFPTEARLHSRSFLLQRAQPALSGLMDGSLSTLAPIFAVVLATHRPLTAFYTGLATAFGAGVSMAFSEGLSDTGDQTGRGTPFLRGSITGVGT